MVNRQRFALWLGVVIVVAHIVISFILWAVFSYGQADGVFLKEISLPVTLGYSIAIVKWTLDNHGIVTDTQLMGSPLVVLISAVTIAFVGGLVITPIYFEMDRSVSKELVNNVYLFIESVFGGMFSLIFSYLYSASAPAND